jgi:hypothetical protein
VVILEQCEKGGNNMVRMPVTPFSQPKEIMNDILTKVDFPTKKGALYLYKGKYKLINDILDGVTVIKTVRINSDNGYFSFISIRFGGFEYHHEIESQNCERVFFGGEWFEINEGD